jgi:hypothetical protein
MKNLYQYDRDFETGSSWMSGMSANQQAYRDTRLQYWTGVQLAWGKTEFSCPCD